MNKDNSTTIFLCILAVAVVIMGISMFTNKSGNLGAGSPLVAGYNGAQSSSVVLVGYTVSGAAQLNTSSTVAVANPGRIALLVCNNGANTVTLCKSSAPKCVFGKGFPLYTGTSSPATCKQFVDVSDPYTGVVSASVNATTSSSTLTVTESNL